MPNQNNTQKPLSTSKEYFSEFGLVNKFFVPHTKANHLNAQDVVCELVDSAKNISIATFNCFEDGRRLITNPEIVASLIYEINTKLEMIEKILPMAFQEEYDQAENNKAVTL